VTDEQAVQGLREIVRLAGEIATDSEHPALRNRAIEIAANADIMLWSLAPEQSEWLDSIYGGGPTG
jgi:hypothetical protein